MPPPPFLQHFLILSGILKLKNNNKFKLYRFLKAHHLGIECGQQTLEFLAKNLDEINFWLESDEFKEKYINTNHPYPPLLNPERLTKESKNPYPNLSYQTIPAELAWDLNLPLPQCDMVKFESHGVGGGAFESFFAKLGIAYVTQGLVRYARELYIFFFIHINNGARVIILRNYYTIRQQNAGKKLHSLIPKPKILTLNQVRDPISMLKGHISYKRRPDDAITKFSFKQNPQEIVSTLIRYGKKKESFPSTKGLPSFLSDILKGDASYIHFHDYQLFSEIINIKDSEVEFIDMSEIVGKQTLSTMWRFAKLFNVPFPKEDKEFFLTKRSDLGEMLPLTFYVTDERISLYNPPKHGIKIHICSKISGGDDISLEMLGYIPDRVKIVTTKKNLDKLRTDLGLYKRTQEYLQEFIKALLAQHNAERAKKFTEEDLLKFMRENKEAREDFKSILDRHLSLIKQMRPNIVASWKYYQQFERICRVSE